jgi:hypothetical protein
VVARGISTRINPEGLKALRQLALDRDTTVQALMIEATNDLLRKYRRRAVAETAPRSLAYECVLRSGAIAGWMRSSARSRRGS